MMSLSKVGFKNAPKLFWLFSLTLLIIQAVPALAVNQYVLDCKSCHGMPPLDSAQRDVVTGAFQGNHLTHLPAAANPNDCVKCHNNNAYTIDHYNGAINMAARINNYSAVSVGAARYNKPIFFNQTSKPVLATCSNVNCHFESVTPVWSSAMPGQPADCNLCHSFPPNNGVSGTSHAKHNNNTAAWGGLFGPMVCTPCHTDGGVNGQPYWTYQHASSAGNRGIHFDSTLNYTGTATKFLPSQAASRVFGSCSNTYCHSNGVQGAGNVKVATPLWGVSANCGSCHASPMVSNGHSIHSAAPYAYGCELCHAATVSNSTTIIPSTGVAKHTNNNVEVAFGGYAGTGTGVASCATTYCHNGATVAPVWNNAASVTCGSCHKADNATITTFAHPVHLNSASVAYGPTYLQTLPGGTNASSCKICHTTYPVNHVNNAKDVNLSSCSTGIAGNNCHGNAVLTVANWQTARAAITCESCHMTPKLSVIPTGTTTFVTAPDQTLSKTKGHTAPTNSLGGPMTGAPVCTTCHDATTAHISGVIGDAVRLPATQPNDNTQCASCHNTGKVVSAFRNMSTHFTTKGGPQNSLCKTCHDPHGTTNLSMVRTQLKGSWLNATAVSITYTDAVNGFINTTNNRGLCQVCHTKTSHYRAGIPEGNGHHTSGCLGCHGHNAAGGAFKPTGGACDSCHGYPPLPKGLAGLTFGTAGNFANGRFEDYSGGGGAHFVKDHVKLTAVASEGWSNCVKCHNGGNLTSFPNHLMLTPVKSNIANVTVKVDQQYRFNDGVMITYTGAKLAVTNNKTGTCSNVECHFQPSRRWSSQR
jgi:predicted CxxxxCH...CXXCH cytochrome family protein